MSSVLVGYACVASLLLLGGASACGDSEGPGRPGDTAHDGAGDPDMGFPVTDGSGDAPPADGSSEPDGDGSANEPDAPASDGATDRPGDASSDDAAFVDGDLDDDTVLDGGPADGADAIGDTNGDAADTTPALDAADGDATTGGEPDAPGSPDADGSAGEDADGGGPGDDAGPPSPAAVGCADGTREGFLDVSEAPLLAACAGGWSIPGVNETEPACGRQGGDDGPKPDGEGCNVTDLCAEGWHVCLGKNDVAARNEDGCEGILDGAQKGQFFLARTSSSGAFNCSPDAIADNLNDIFGCGDLGCPANEDSCEPLTRGSHNLCKSLNYEPTASCECQKQDGEVTCSPNSGGCGWCQPLDYWATKLDEELPETWECGDNSTEEAANVVKTGPELGGVLCCKNL